MGSQPDRELQNFASAANPNHVTSGSEGAVKTSTTFQVIDLFGGCGGLSVGFHRAGFESVLAVDYDRPAVDTYNRNFGTGKAGVDGHPIGPGICDSIQNVLDFVDADVIVGGPPCQGFSLLGVQHRRVVEMTTGKILDEPRNQLWKEYLRVVRDVEPHAFVMENVPPLLKSAEFLAFVSEVESSGYELVRAVLNAADYGVPQRRKRAIVIGSRVGRPWLPWPTHCEPNRTDDGRPVLFEEEPWVVGASFTDPDGQFGPTDFSKSQGGRLRPWRTVRDAFLHDGRPLPLEPDEVDWHIGRNPKPLSLERYRTIPPGGNRFDLPNHLKPECWRNKPSGSTDLFGRLDWNKPALTIRTEFFKPEKGRYLHPQADRPITHREAMRLQTFPDEFEWCGSKIEVAKQVGNAVPCALAHHVASAVHDLLVQARVARSGAA